jgi:hypothetical protein
VLASVHKDSMVHQKKFTLLVPKGIMILNVSDINLPYPVPIIADSTMVYVITFHGQFKCCCKLIL